MLADVEGAHSEAVAGEDQRALAPIPQRERELSVEPLEGADPPRAEGLDHDLGIAGRAEAAAPRRSSSAFNST